MRLESYAKLNLFLNVISLRRDNYHNINTLFERIDLHDEIILKAYPGKKIKIICRDADVPSGPNNLCYLAASLLQDEFKVSRGAEIRIIKRIPVGAGLAGGSSNAASVFLGLNKIWGLGLSRNRLVTLAKRIGCDIPFFLYGLPFARGSLRGDKITPLEAWKGVRLWHILVVPRIKVPTPLIYRKWDALFRQRPGLTRRGSDVKILTLALLKKGLLLGSHALYNSLQEVTTRLYPEINRIRENLKRLGVKSILMSGSGPAVFGIVSGKKEAQALSGKLRRINRSWKVFAVRTR